MAICYNNANIKTIEYFEELEKKVYFNYGLIPKQEDSSSGTIVVVATWNIGRGTKERNVTATRLADVIRENNIDIIGVQEAKNNGTTLISNVANRSGMDYYYTATPAGNAVLSKYGFISRNYYSLVSCAERRALQKTVINIKGINVSFYNVHISYQSGCLNKQIKDVYNKVKNDPNPFVLVGDFNVATKCSIIRDIFGYQYPIIARDTFNNRHACTDSIIMSLSNNIRFKSGYTVNTDGSLTDHNMVISILEIKK